VDIAEMAAGFGERFITLALLPALQRQLPFARERHRRAFLGETASVGMLGGDGDELIGPPTQYAADTACVGNVLPVDLAKQVAGAQGGVGGVEGSTGDDGGDFHSRSGIALV